MVLFPTILVAVQNVNALHWVPTVLYVMHVASVPAKWVSLGSTVTPAKLGFGIYQVVDAKVRDFIELHMNYVHICISCRYG